MKKIIIILTVWFSLAAINLYSQCESYEYDLATTGFTCDLTPGEICVSSYADGHYPLDECIEYYVEIEYPKGDFIFTDLGDFEVFYEDNYIVKLRAHIDLMYDIKDFVCLQGVLQEPGTAFILRIIHPDTGHVVNGETFYLDNEEEIGTDGQDILLTQAIIAQSLLAPDDSWKNPQKVYIHGNLLIDIDYIFGVGSNLRMAPGSSIKVQPNYYLDIVKSSVYSCNEEEWNGILVEQNATLYFNRSEINNANVAIELLHNSTCEVYASKFDNNNIGIGCFGDDHKDISLSIIDHPFLGTNSFINGNIGIKLENTTELNTGMLGSGYGNLTTGIDLDGVDIITTRNTFSHCNYGIVSKNAPNHVDVKYNEFYYNATGIKVEGAPLCEINNHNYFESNNTAIKIISSEMDEVTYIEDNIIAYCDFGIFGALKQSRGNIMNNEIITKYSDVSLFGTLGQQIWATQYNDIYVYKHAPFITNVMYNNITNGRVFQNSMGTTENGIKIEGGSSNYVGYNDVSADGNRPGIRFNYSDMSWMYCNVSSVDNGSGIVILGNNSGGDIRGNDTDWSSMGLQYGTTSQTFAHTGTQVYKGNTFAESTPDDPKAINYSTAPVAKRNLYILGLLAGQQGSKYYPYFIANINNWFSPVLEEQIVDYKCPSGSSGGNPDIVTPDDYTKVIKEDTAIVKVIKKEYGDGGILKDAKVKTIKHILDYWELGGNMFNDVLQDPEYQDVAQLATLDYQLNQELSEQVFDDDEVENWVNDMDEIVGLINNYQTFTVDSLAGTVVLHTDDPEYLNLLHRLDTTKVRFAAKRTAKQANIDAVVSELIKECESIPGKGSIYTQYYRDILSLAMQMQLSNFKGFGSTQKSMIAAISDECSYLYPRPVFLARSLRATYDTEIKNYADDCEDVQPIELRDDTGKTDFELYPNPASQYLTIVLKGDNETKFEILNNVGKVIDVIEVKGSKKIDINDFATGIYFLRDISGKLSTKKFTIAK